MDVRLLCHPKTPALAVPNIGVQIIHDPAYLSLLFSVGAPSSTLSVPTPQKPYRTDGLWRTTCFELFVRGDGRGYTEYNFSPSSQWAAYAFTDYRAGMKPLEAVEPPQVRWCDEGQFVVLSVMLEPMPAGGRIALTAVIEELDGTKSYWALAHPPGAPDFHHPDCFVLDLPPPEHP